MKYTVGLDTDFYCRSALSGQKALDMIKQDYFENRVSRFSLIFMDCNMPGIDGFETTASIREFLYEKGQDQPIISAVTGHVEQVYIDQAIMAGMN